eukprot:TRINITY_DN4789_c0_g1_i4.p1 TRINITY_DN4789_c0_g1~~TRINITY_DN4789_c0_g1_i4.p1  ORF type:complete len:446 (+),score=88.68 TRINITY_DN4789_c0_g1_i4:49-1386(+)
MSNPFPNPSNSVNIKSVDASSSGSLSLGLGLGDGGNVSSSFARLTVAALFGGLAAVGIYKAYLENEEALVRRLTRLKGKNGRPVRIWLDGCFDLMHFGHANAFRQARSMGDLLVVGLNGDEEIKKVKGPPIMTEDERYTAVAACKWVDEVVRDVPYVMNEEYLMMLFDKYQVDYIVHGDDPCVLADGTDVFAAAKRLGRYKTIKRTEGVSTTDIVGRMLLMTKDHHHKSEADLGADLKRRLSSGSLESMVPVTKVSNFLPTTRRLREFSTGKTPKATDRIVYVDGAFDMFHAGHIDLLRGAKEMGDFLIVGLYTDDVVNQYRGSNYPILNLYERVLSVLSCRYVDEVIMGAPWQMTRDVITSMNISVVACGDISERYGFAPENLDPYAIPREMGILRVIPSTRQLTTQTIVDRILTRRMEFETKYERKSKQELEYLANKTFVEES